MIFTAEQMWSTVVCISAHLFHIPCTDCSSLQVENGNQFRLRINNKQLKKLQSFVLKLNKSLVNTLHLVLDAF